MGISFDIIGDIAIVEAVNKEQEKEIVGRILKAHRHVKTILRKAGERSGKYRLRKFKTLYGKNTVTVHKEYGCRLALDVRKAYFSPRESTERQRIAGQVKPKEHVLVMFAGVGPYAIAIAKRQKNVGKIFAIEINPYAVRYMKENIRINKLEGRIIPVLGDVKKKAKDYYNKCDRVVMPLPQEGHGYLEEALRCLRKNGIIHFYCISSGNDLFSGAEKAIKSAAKRLRKKTRIISRKRVLPYGPRTWKVCVDLKVVS